MLFPCVSLSVGKSWRRVQRTSVTCCKSLMLPRESFHLLGHGDKAGRAKCEAATTTRMKKASDKIGHRGREETEPHEARPLSSGESKSTIDGRKQRFQLLGKDGARAHFSFLWLSLACDQSFHWAEGRFHGANPTQPSASDVSRESLSLHPRNDVQSLHRILGRPSIPWDPGLNERLRLKHCLDRRGIESRRVPSQTHSFAVSIFPPTVTL